MVSYSLPRSLTRADLTCMLLACTTGLYRCTHEQAQPLAHAIRHDLHIRLAHASCDTHTRQYALRLSSAHATICQSHLWPACASNRDSHPLQAQHMRPRTSCVSTREQVPLAYSARTRKQLRIALIDRVDKQVCLSSLDSTREQAHHVIPARTRGRHDVHPWLAHASLPNLHRVLTHAGTYDLHLPFAHLSTRRAWVQTTSWYGLSPHLRASDGGQPWFACPACLRLYWSPASQPLAFPAGHQPHPPLKHGSSWSPVPHDMPTSLQVLRHHLSAALVSSGSFSV